MEISDISRINDYRYAIEDLCGGMQGLVFESREGIVDGAIASRARYVWAFGA